MQVFKQSFSAVAALGIVSVVWGTTWVASRQGVLYMPALQLAGIRQLLGGFAFLAYYLPKGLRFPKGAEWMPLLVLALLNFILSNGLSTWGVAYISSGLAAIIGSLYPIWLVVIGYILYRRLPSILTVLGMVLGLTGICIIFYTHLGDLLNSDFRFGILLSLAATVSWALGTLYTKSHSTEFDLFQSIGYQMVISGVILYMFADWQGVTVSLDSIPWQSWASILYLVLFGSLIGFGCYLYALQHLSTEEVSVYAYINPIVAVFTGGILFGETIDILMIAGSLLTILGVYLVNKSVRDL
jgi:drug/metabolite transporter (DMT)-like permease